MVVMTPRQTWTDERLDEFKENVNQRFDQIEKRLDRIDGDIRELRQSVERMSTRMTTGFFALAGLIVSGQVFF
jgi:chaperonin cofactor prefoldin